jgi:glycosyltransferase involved in cell wall biosynthesis
LEKDNFPHKLYKHSLSYLSQSPARDRIHLFTDSEDLKSEYKYYTNKPFRLLPIPHIQSSSGKESHNIQREKLTIGYLGDARTNKGFHLIPEAIKNVTSILGDNGCVWEIQANIRNHLEWQTVQAVNLLKTMPNINLYHNPMDTNVYHKLMADIDIFILPYTLENYHSQTSGVFTEIRGLGKVSVVTSGTWMAREINSNGGGILCAPEDSKSLGDAIITCVNSYSKLKSEAESTKDTWCDFHNSQKYLSDLTSDISFTSTEKMGL